MLFVTLLYILASLSIFTYQMQNEKTTSRLLQVKYSIPDVEPIPKIRLYVYNTPNTFNPNNDMFSKRILHELMKNAHQDENKGQHPYCRNGFLLHLPKSQERLLQLKRRSWELRQASEREGVLRLSQDEMELPHQLHPCHRINRFHVTDRC